MRAAVVEATVTVAANLEALSGSPAPGDAPSNLLLRDVFDGLTDTNPAVQHAAAACLVQVMELAIHRFCPLTCAQLLCYPACANFAGCRGTFDFKAQKTSQHSTPHLFGKSSNKLVCCCQQGRDHMF